jgi:hypothetical protein
VGSSDPKLLPGARQKLLQRRDEVVVFVCRKSANIRMALTKSRMQLDKLESAL